MSTIKEDNHAVFHKMSVFLNYEPRFVTSEMMEELTQDCGLSATDAFALLLAAAVGLNIGEQDNDRRLYERYFPTMVHRLDIADFQSDPYLTTIRFPQKGDGAWSFCNETYSPYEAFACNDPVTLFDGRVIPQIGFFETSFSFPAVLENGREWMTVTPNEINTMRQPIAAARGNVLTYGLGLGYFAFMAARKTEVTSITVVERDPAVIRLFRTHIAPQIPFTDKIRIIEADAFRFAETEMATGSYDMVFADIWHDPSDGVDAYLRLKACEKHLPGADYHYWIEKTLKLYL